MFKINKEKANKITKKVKKKHYRKFNKEMLKTLNYLDKHIKKASKKGDYKLVILFDEGRKYKRKVEWYSESLRIIRPIISGYDFIKVLEKSLIDKGFFVIKDKRYKAITIRWDDLEDE